MIDNLLQDCTFARGNLVTWRKQENVVARSSVEAEFRSMAHGICKLMWLKILMEYLRLLTERSTKLYRHNKSAISVAQNSIQHDRTKHVEIDRYFVKEKINSGVSSLLYVSSTNQLADILTAGISTKMLDSIGSKLDMVDT